MPNLFELAFVNTFNRAAQAGKPRLTGGLPLGSLVLDERVTKQPYFLPVELRKQHMAIQGKTGSGKSYFIRHMAEHEVDSKRGFALFDLHGGPFTTWELIPKQRRVV